MWLLTGYLVSLTLVVTGFLALVLQASGALFPALGTQLFSSLALGFVLLLAFITPALTAGAVSGERERRTLDLLLVTPASPLGLVGGKLLGSLLYILFLLAASAPAFALVYLFGGVPLRYLVLTLVVAATTAVTHASLGLLLSALLRRTVTASVVAYLLVFGLVLALPFAAGVAGLARQGQGPSGGPTAGPPPPFLYASPLVALASALPAGSSSVGVPLVGDLIRAVLFAGRGGGPVPVTVPATAGAAAILSVGQSVYVSARPYPASAAPETVTVLAPWVYYLGVGAGLTVVSLLGAALAVAPVKPWQRLRRRIGRWRAGTGAVGGGRDGG
jgi:ABC-type transport system involved in multi-copper enzyme maturation permease subunit